MDVIGLELECDDDLARKLGQPTSTLPIVHLGLSLLNCNRSALHFFITACKPTLRHLDLGTTEWPASLSSEVMSPMVDIAPQLRSFASRSRTKSYFQQSTNLYLMATLRALKDVRTIELGINGYDLTTIFSVLEPLKHLRVLSFTDPDTSNTSAIFDKFDVDSIDHFLSQAPALELLILPHQLDVYWYEDGYDKLNQTAVGSGVEVRLA